MVLPRLTNGTKEMACEVDQTGLHQLFGAAAPDRPASTNEMACEVDQTGLHHLLQGPTLSLRSLLDAPSHPTTLPGDTMCAGFVCGCVGVCVWMGVCVGGVCVCGWGGAAWWQCRQRLGRHQAQMPRLSQPSAPAPAAPTLAAAGPAAPRQAPAVSVQLLRNPHSRLMSARRERRLGGRGHPARRRFGKLGKPRCNSS